MEDVIVLNREKVHDLQAVYGTPQGLKVLTDFLLSNYFFHEAPDDGARIRRNMAVKVLTDMGALRKETVYFITAALVRIAVDNPINFDEGVKKL